jgi:hypothetical protein
MHLVKTRDGNSTLVTILRMFGVLKHHPKLQCQNMHLSRTHQPIEFYNPITL